MSRTYKDRERDPHSFGGVLDYSTRAQERMDLIRAVEIVVRAAIVDADTYQAKVDLAALGSQIIALVGNSKL
jgi:hypothetical protein